MTKNFNRSEKNTRSYYRQLLYHRDENMLAELLLMAAPLTLPAINEGNAVGGWLSQPILPANGFESEVQHFIKSHVPRLQVPDTAAQWEKKSRGIAARDPESSCSSQRSHCVVQG